MTKHRDPEGAAIADLTIPTRSAQTLRRTLLHAPARDSRARSRALGALFLAGGVLGILSVATDVGRAVWDVVDVVLAIGLLVAGCSLVAIGRRLPAGWFHVIIAVATVAVAIAQWEDGPGITPLAYPMLYMWIALYVGHFFSPAAVAGHLSLALAGYAIVLSSMQRSYGFEVLVLAASISVIAFVTNWLSRSGSLAQLDALTGVANRRGLDRTLEAAMRSAEARADRLAVGLLDLDDFRSVNELHGHGGGDRLLVECVQRWQALLPADVTLARYDGDGFVVVLPGYGLRDARELVERLRAAVPAPQTGSAGVTGWAPGDTQSMLIGRADTALYRAKRQGRDRVYVVGEESERADELLNAIVGGEMQLHYQPIHSLSDGRLESVEALIRWSHPTRGLISPADFIPLAERTGAIHVLGSWVIDTACEQLQRWRAALPEAADVSMSINVSPAQLTHPRLADDLRDALARCRLPAADVVIEITESAFAHDSVEVGEVLDDLRRIGVRLAMDDFGTGHSSLGRLCELPFDILKIDRSFVARLGETGDPLLEAIVGVAQSLGLETIAEGIEEASQLRFAAEYGCTRAQGFLLGRPKPAHELEALLRSGSRLQLVGRQLAEPQRSLRSNGLRP